MCRKTFVVLIVIVVFLIQPSLVISQTPFVDTPLSIDYKNIPQEKVFIHFNTSLLYTGEYLYYKVYCISSKTDRLSDFSKVAYVELISEDLRSVFKHKIKLDKGIGQGDFFLPVAVPSGNYKLIGYTQWMNNKLENNFFQGDISIINPYLGDQKSILITSEDDQQTQNQSEYTSQDNIGDLQLLLNKKVFSKREEVQLTIRSIKGNAGQGNYSVSVKKKDTFRVPVKYTSKTYTSLYTSKKDKYASEVIPPELRGELVSGKITSTEPKVLVANKKIAVSIPGENYELQIAAANEEGVFYFNVDKEHNESNVLVQVLGNQDKYMVELLDAKSPDYKTLSFYKFRLTTEMKPAILERSVYNQIRNGYFSVKPDTLKVLQEKTRFYGDMAQVYDLDDYTRFPTIRETLVEIVNNAWIKKIGEEEYVFQVRGYDYTTADFVFLPLVIIDGVIIQDHSSIINYNANKIKRIKLIRDLYFLNSQMFQGVIDIETIEGDYHESIKANGLYSLQLPKPLPVKKYYQERYDRIAKDKADHIPDYRHQLLWKPNFKLTNDVSTIDFFTSDNTGDYEISIEGFTNQGKPISIKETIVVE